MSIFEDTFTVTAVDPDGKVFERGNTNTKYTHAGFKLNIHCVCICILLQYLVFSVPRKLLV